MYAGSVGVGLVFLLFTVLGYALLLVPGLILHVIAILAAYASADSKVAAAKRAAAKA